MSEAAAAITATPTPTPAPAPTPSPAPTPAPAPAPTPTPTPAPAPTPAPTPAPSDRWQDKFLREDLRGNELLSRYDSPEKLAEAHVEVNKWAAGRIPIPKAGDETAFAEFASKMRPAEAKDYDIPVPEGQSSETADAFRPIFHELGLHPTQATKLTQAWNQFAADSASRIAQAGKDEVTALELQYGPSGFQQRAQAVNNMLAGMGVAVEDIVPAMEQVGGGAGKALAALFTMAEKTGELAKVDGDTVAVRLGAMTPELAQQKLDEQNSNTDPEFQRKLTDPNSPERKLRQQLVRIAAGAPTA